MKATDLVIALTIAVTAAGALLLLAGSPGAAANPPVEKNEVLLADGNAGENSAGENDAGGGTVPWKEEFDRICAQTVIATTLPAEQLLALISATEALLERLRGVADPWTKVYIFRLESCLDFFRYALELKELETQD